MRPGPPGGTRPEPDAGRQAVEVTTGILVLSLGFKVRDLGFF